jgi:ureidoacrylate peracid hydrolase
MRAAGGSIVWIQTTAAGGLEQWSNYHRFMLTPERRQRRLASLDEGAEGFKLYPALDVLPDDLRVNKIKYSAFIAGSSDATLNSFLLFFGDVMTTDEAIAKLVPVMSRKSA